MGLIRKSLSVGTLGVVHGSSKKQRVAKATQRNIAATNQLLAQQAAQAKADEEYRYQTDENYRNYVDERRAESIRAHNEFISQHGAVKGQLMLLARSNPKLVLYLIVFLFILGIFAVSTLSGGSSKSSTKQSAVTTAPVTETSTSVPPTTSQPSSRLTSTNIPAATLAFLNCTTITKGSPWSTCRRDGDVAYLRPSGTSPAVYNEIRQRSDFNPNAFSLFRTDDGGYVYVPSLTGAFADTLTSHTGPFPGMDVVTEADAGVSSFS